MEDNNNQNITSNNQSNNNNEKNLSDDNKSQINDEDKNKKDNIHDKYIKNILGKIENVKSLFENYLPQNLKPLLNLDCLESVKDSFVDEKLKEHFSDLIYKTKTKDGKGVFIYTLIDHKSNYDKFSAVKFLKYVALLYDKYYSNKMPIIIPLLLYNGKKEWKPAKDLIHLFKDVDENFRKYIPNFNFEFYDFVREKNIIGNDEIKLLILSFIYRVYPHNKQILERVNFLYLDK
jgi:predicted transposase/invertase (TIGR01784 family)